MQENQANKDGTQTLEQEPLRENPNKHSTTREGTKQSSEQLSKLLEYAEREGSSSQNPRTNEARRNSMEAKIKNKLAHNHGSEYKILPLVNYNPAQKEWNIIDKAWTR